MKIDILGEKWTIKFEPSVSFEGKDVAGYCDNTKRLIKVAIGYPKETIKSEVIKQISEAYWHEIAHGVFFEGALRDQSWWTEDREHTIISPLAKVLAKKFSSSGAWGCF